MKNYILLLIIILFFLGLAFAGNIQPPSPRIDKPTREYLKTIADNFNRLEVITVNPDGARNGNYGDMVLLVTGGNYYLEICISSPDGTVWRGTQLTDLP